MSNDYKPVPVEAAKAIAHTFDKNEVIIVSQDDAFGLTHFTTYGKSPENKAHAAVLGDIIAKGLGSDLEVKQSFEDFRDCYDAAKYRALQEKHDAITVMLRRFLVAHRDTHRNWIEAFIEVGAITADFNYHPLYPFIKAVHETPGADDRNAGTPDGN